MLGYESTQLLDRLSPFGATAKNIERVGANHLEMLASKETLVPGIVDSRMNCGWRTLEGEGAPSSAQNDLICNLCSARL